MRAAVQFIAHPDHVNYPCDAAGGYPYMNIEIVAVKLQGTYACGSPGKPDFNVLRSGWADQPCDCDHSLEYANCGRNLLRANTTDSKPSPRAATSVPPDCTSASPTDPVWFGGCKADGGCMRVQVASSLPSLVLSNSTNGTSSSAGLQWCIDH